MSAYWIGRAKTRDPDGIGRYNALRMKAAEKYPQQSLVRNGRFKVLEGPDDFDRYVLIKFPSVEDAVRYYHSPEYQAAAAERHAACDRCDLAIVEGL